MENPAHVYTTGIPMSQKGNLIQNKHGCNDGKTLDDIRIPSINDHNYQNNTPLILNGSTSGNAECIANSLQDGFQSEILCDFVSNAGLPSEDIRLENGLEIESISDNQIKFPDSPGSSFPVKISSFSSVENFVPCLDEHLDNYLLSDFKSESKSDSDDGQYSEEENRTVTEAISAIAKSFGLENLLPENFQNDADFAASTGGLCDEDNNISDLSLGDFEKCTALHSPASSLDLTDQLSEDVQDFGLSTLDMLNSPSQHESECPTETLEIGIKKEPLFFINPKGDYTLTDDKISRKISESKSEIIYKTNNINNSFSYDEKVSQDNIHPIVSIPEPNIHGELTSDVPLMQIPDIPETVEGGESCPAAGTVLITRDKTSNKMQIVLTLDQGQQVYDIDTENIDVNEHNLGLELQNALNEQPLLNTELDSMELLNMAADKTEEAVSSILTEDIEEEQFFENPTSYMEIVGMVPVTVTRTGKNKKCFECPIEGCGQSFDKECKMKVHMFSHNESGRPFKCTVEGCNWAFTTPYRLRRHAETHLGSKEYICDVEGCNRKFTTVYNLKTHLKRHKWGIPLICPAQDCGLSFSNRRKLELHLRIHKDVEAPYKCSLCGKQYYSANCIASHYRTHQYNEDDFKCPFQGCGKVYDKICRLKQHIRHHTGDRPYVCPAEGCKWSFMSASKLTRHMRKHTGERKFVCTEPGCGKSFMRPEHLKGHVVIHSGDKPFHCPHENCTARFTAKSSLYVHVKKHCPSILKVVYPCPITSCVKKYNSKATLKQHLVKFHPELMGEGKELTIAEKLELTMPVSLVGQNEDNSASILELEEGVTDDPSTGVKVQLIESSQPSLMLNNLSSEETSNSTSKQSKGRSQNKKVSIKLSSNKNCNLEIERSESNSRFVKLFQKTKNGCARTDIYCTYLTESKNVDPPPSYVFLNHYNNDTQDIKSYLNHQSTEIKSPDLMLASSIILHDQSSEQFMKSNFLSDDCSNGLYHEDSLLISSSAFETELIPVSLLSDSVESDESVLIDTSSVIFSEQNHVDTFIEPISLQGLD